MPNIKSSEKDVKKSRENRLRNLETKSKIKTFVKKTRSSAEARDVEAAQTLLRASESVIDKAAERGIIHKNAAARRKSRLAKAVNKASS